MNLITLEWISRNDLTILNSVMAQTQPAFVLITGASCSGKTTVANWFAKNLSNSAVISMDNYFLDSNDPSIIPLYNRTYPAFDMPEAYHWDELENTIRTLKNGQDAHTPIYAISKGQRATETNLIKGNKDFYFIEGLYAFKLSDLKIPSFKIFVDAEPEIRYERRMRRYIKNLYPRISRRSIENVVQRVQLAATDLILPQKHQADLVLVSNIERS